MKCKEITHSQSDHISVCICTFRRPDLLAELLNALSEQVTQGQFVFSIVVIDNDYRQTAEAVVLRAMSPVQVTYDVEPIQNISLARNKAVQRARGNFIAFIDDDEIPLNTWLLNLHTALYQFNADGVLGPVLPRFKVRPPMWVLRGRFYERPTYHTGFIIDWRKGRTGNILLKKEIFSATRELFDPKFGSGAEDQDFIRRMIKRGYLFIWCNEARAYEYVPPIRWKRAFLIKRALLRGKVSLNHSDIVLPILLKAFFAIPIYTMALPLLILLGHHIFMKYLIKDFDHIGRLLSFLGLDVIKQKYITE